jgi:predicted PurR-regulated permease PerM
VGGAQFVLGFAVGAFTFIGLLLLSRFVDPIFGRYALLLSVTAGILELLPIIGPIIAAVPAVLIAATAGPEAAIAALILYTLVQQIENNFLVPKIQGDATELHPAAVMFAIIIGGALGGLVGAILALPVAAAGRDVVRYLFRRVGGRGPGGLATIVRRVGMAPASDGRTGRRGRWHACRRSDADA